MKKANKQIWVLACLRPCSRAKRYLLWFFCAGVGILASALVAGVVLRQAIAIGSLLQANSAAPQLYPLQTKPPYTVALDAGHGGTDTGAQALVDEIDVCEKTVDALIALLVSDPNYCPVRTRTNGADPSSADRAQAATDQRACLLLSVHANCDPGNRQSHGFECFPTPPGRTYYEESVKFAQCIAAEMKAAGHRLRASEGIAFAYYNGKQKKMVPGSDVKVRKQKSFGIVEKPLCPAVLAEQCFLTNYSDVENWATDSGCQKAAGVYYRAICAYFGTEPIPVGG